MDFLPHDILAFGAHPDDVELGCGGTLARMTALGYRAGIVDLTEGEMGTRGTVAERYAEAEDARALLGAATRDNLQLPDGGIRLTGEARDRVVDVLRRYRPALVFAPYPSDRHPDHEHASRLVVEAAFYAGVAKIPPAGRPAHRPLRVIHYPMTEDFTPAFLVDISDYFETKTAALKAHRSQFFNPEYEGAQTFISSPEYWEYLEVRARYWGFRAGVRYAEPFWVKEPLRVDDPVALFGGAAR